ncbi:hypothetical protein EDD85DRAFT_948367 [Armillaria nabsnona]|nr:hypothetical protein EDD85DRAFT_948367 [Armillaria nabsnona]
MFKEAIQRTTMQSNLLRAYPDEEVEYEEPVDVYEMQVDEAYLEEYVDDDTGYDSPEMTYAVIRDPPETRLRTRECQAVAKAPVNSTSQHAKTVVRGPTKAATTNPYGTRMNPNTWLATDIPNIHTRGSCMADSPLPPEPIPVDAQPPREISSAEIEDVEMGAETSPSIVGQNPSTPLNEDIVAKRRAERQPMITRRFEADSLMNSTLNAPVTISMGELMACSPELRKRIVKELQYHAVRISKPIESQGSHYLEVSDSEPAKVNLVRVDPIRAQPITRAPLIIISMNLGTGENQLIVKAIVDSGSEINIVCQTVARELNKQYPITPLQQIRCSDANGNKGILYGKFTNVHIHQAGVITNAVFFVGSQNISFELLLGRPWIRGNLVSMDERVEGTYLVYTNPTCPKDYTELLVVDDRWDTKSQGMAPTYLAQAENVEFEGSWRIDEGQEIIETSPPVTYWTFMTTPAPVYSPDQEILNRLRTVLNQEDISDPAMVLPPNNIPRPSPLTNSHEYFPLLDSVCRTQLGYLCNSLYHPDVTDADSFHAILLTTNHALQLETDLFDGHCLQRTHAFNATLAELQGPDGLPISSFEGNYEAYPTTARLGDEIPVHGSQNTCDSDEECSSASSVHDSSSNSSEKAIHVNKNIPPPQVIISLANATVTTSRAPSANLVIEDVEVKAMMEQAMQIIKIKREEACAVFCIPIDFHLVMHLNESFFEQLTKPLPREMTLCMDYVARTVIRSVNEKGCALLLHNPLFLFNLHQSLFSNRPTTEDSQVTLHMPHFPADIFMLMESATEHTELTDTLPPLMSASSSKSEREIRAMDSPADALEHVDGRVDVPENIAGKEEQKQVSPPPYSPDMNQMVSSPIETQSILPRAPTPMPGRSTQLEPETMMVEAANEEEEHPKSSTQVFFTQLQTDSVSSNHVETIPALGRSHSLDNSETSRRSRTEPWRDKKTKNYQALRLNMPLNEDSADHSETLPTEECGAHPIDSIEEKSQPVDAASPMSEDSQPHDSSAPTSAQSDSTDDYNQFSPMSLDDMRRANLKSVFYKEETIVHHFHGANNNSPLQDKLNGLIPSNHEKYSKIVGTDEYKISTLDWANGHSRMTKEELEDVRIKIFEERAERDRLKQSGQWGTMYQRGKEEERYAQQLIQELPLGVEMYMPPPGVVVFLEKWELRPVQDHVAAGKRLRSFTKTHHFFRNDVPYTFLDITKSKNSAVRANPWRPVANELCRIRIVIRRFIGLIVKQFTLSQWRDAVDRLSPQDDTRHFFYFHNESLQYIDGRFTSYMQGFNHRCYHNDPQPGSLREARQPRNPLLTVSEDEFLYHAAAMFEHEGQSELANHIRYAQGGQPFMADEARILFEEGYIDATIYYNDDGHHRSFWGDEYDLRYYDNEEV